jgi:hypothetical protein
VNPKHTQHTGAVHPASAREPRLAMAPWVISTCVHAGVIVGGFFIVWAAAPEPAGDPRATILSFASQPEAPRAESVVAQDLADASAATPMAREPVRDAVEAPTMADVLALPELATPSTPVPRIGVDAPALTGLAALPEVRFFGVGSTDVRSVVYVVDASGSMVATFPFILAELERSARALDALQRFQVIFFKGDAASASGRVAAPDPVNPNRVRETRLIRCTPEHVRSVLTWARTVIPGGRSDPMEALRVAIGLNPDAILMLSSSIAGTGEWEIGADEVLAELEALNPRDPRTGRRPISIMTIQIFEDDPSGLLRAIGERHGPPGTGHRFIARSDLQR